MICFLPQESNPEVTYILWDDECMESILKDGVII